MCSTTSGGRLDYLVSTVNSRFPVSSPKCQSHPLALINVGQLTDLLASRNSYGILFPLTFGAANGPTSTRSWCPIALNNASSSLRLGRSIMSDIPGIPRLCAISCVRRPSIVRTRQNFVGMGTPPALTIRAAAEDRLAGIDGFAQRGGRFSGGVPLGATMPYQTSASYPGTVSAIVGISSNPSHRFSESHPAPQLASLHETDRARQVAEITWTLPAIKSG